MHFPSSPLHTLPGALGSPISPSPPSSYDEIPAHIASPLSPPPPPGTMYHTSNSPTINTAHATFTNGMFEKSPIKRLYHPGLVRNLDPSFGTNETSSVANNPVSNISGQPSSRQSPVISQQAHTAQASTSRPPANVPSTTLGLGCTGIGYPSRPTTSPVFQRPNQDIDLLIPILHYTGRVDIDTFPTIGQDTNSEEFHPCSGTFQV